MNGDSKTKSKTLYQTKVKRIFWFAMLFWTSVVSVTMTWNLFWEFKETERTNSILAASGHSKMDIKELVEKDKSLRLNLMRRTVIEDEKCLNCHGIQNYEIGASDKILDLSPIDEIVAARTRATILGFCFMWLLGVLGIWYLRFSALGMLDQAPDKPRHFGGGEARKAYVLVAEDDKFNQKIITDLLDEMNCEADIVSNGIEAITALQKITYDMVLMDCQMPEMNGFEATRVIRDEESEVLDHSLPVIALTTYGLQKEQDDCIDVGMDDFIDKPIDPQLLQAILKRWTPDQTDL